jgi:hypothetical protein
VLISIILRKNILSVRACYICGLSLILYDLIARTKYSEGMWTRTHAYARPHAHVHDHVPVHTKSSMAAKQSVQLMLAVKSRAINRTCGCDVQTAVRYMT